MKFRFLSPHAFDDFQESGILKEHVIVPDDEAPLNSTLYAKFAINKGKLYTCGRTNDNEYPKLVKAFKTLPQDILDLGDVYFFYCLEDFALAKRSTRKGIFMAKGSHPETWDIAAPDYDFVIEGLFLDMNAKSPITTLTYDHRGCRRHCPISQQI